jgi:hypothetical protein
MAPLAAQLAATSAAGVFLASRSAPADLMAHEEYRSFLEYGTYNWIESPAVPVGLGLDGR